LAITVDLVAMAAWTVLEAERRLSRLPPADDARHAEARKRLALLEAQLALRNLTREWSWDDCRRNPLLAAGPIGQRLTAATRWALSSSTEAEKPWLEATLKLAAEVISAEERRRDAERFARLAVRITNALADALRTAHAYDPNCPLWPDHAATG
jgi:hypothetical protein